MFRITVRQKWPRIEDIAYELVAADTKLTSLRVFIVVPPYCRRHPFLVFIIDRVAGAPSKRD